MGHAALIGLGRILGFGLWLHLEDIKIKERLSFFLSCAVEPRNYDPMGAKLLNGESTKSEYGLQSTLFGWNLHITVTQEGLFTVWSDEVDKEFSALCGWSGFRQREGDDDSREGNRELRCPDFLQNIENTQVSGLVVDCAAKRKC